jgi:hypothetical protein
MITCDLRPHACSQPEPVPAPVPRPARRLPGDRVIPDGWCRSPTRAPSQIRHAPQRPKIQNHPETNPAHRSGTHEVGHIRDRDRGVPCGLQHIEAVHERLMAAWRPIGGKMTLEIRRER